MNFGCFNGVNGSLLPSAQLPGVPFSYGYPGGQKIGFQVPRSEYFDAPVFLGSASGFVTNKVGRLAFSVVPGSGSGGSGIILLRKAPTVPYTIDLYGKFVWTPDAVSTGGSCGIVLFNAHGDYRFVQSDYGQQATPASVGHQRVSVYNISGSTTTNLILYSSSVQASNVYCRITDDGMTKRFWTSANGLDFMQVYSDASSVFGAATKLGILIGASGDSTKPNAVADVYNFVVTPDILGDAP